MRLCDSIGPNPYVVRIVAAEKSLELEVVKIVEELHPSSPLVGTTPEERAETRMWVRRIDHGIVEPMTMGFRGAKAGRCSSRDEARRRRGGG